MSDTDTLTQTVERVTTLVNHYHRDAPFRAPETVPEWQARLHLFQQLGVVVTPP